MHRYGTHAPEVDAGLDHLAKNIQDLFSQAHEHYAKVRFHVFSDHGMSDTQNVSTLMIDWNREFKGKYGRDYVAVWDSTMARFWFNNDDTRKRALSWLSSKKDGRLVSEEELKRWHCWWDDNRYGEHFYLLPAGSIFAPSFMNQGFVAGMHGYDPEHEDSAASWMTNVEGRMANGLEDIFPIMLEAANRENAK